MTDQRLHRVGVHNTNTRQGRNQAGAVGLDDWWDPHALNRARGECVGESRQRVEFLGDCLARPHGMSPIGIGSVSQTCSITLGGDIWDPRTPEEVSLLGRWSISYRCAPHANDQYRYR